MKEVGVEDYTFINELIGKLRNEFNEKLREEEVPSGPSFATSVGGAGKKDAETLIDDFVHEIFDKYDELKNELDKIIKKHKELEKENPDYDKAEKLAISPQQ